MTTTWTLIVLFYGLFMSENVVKIEGFNSQEACKAAGTKMIHDINGVYNKFNCFEVAAKEGR